MEANEAKIVRITTGLNREKERPEWIMLWACIRKLWPDDLPGYRYWIYGISDSQRVGKLIRFLCVFRFSGNKITQRARAQWVEKENRVLLGWYSTDGFTDFGGSSTGPVWFLCRDWSSWRGSSLSTEVCGWAILEVSDNPQKVSPPGGGRILTEYPDQISGLEGGSWDW